MESDAELLRDYALRRSEIAFGKLVERYRALVFSACRRRLHDVHLAEDATQIVFTLLAERAGTLDSTLLVPWLLATAHNVSRNLARENRRRDRREQQAAHEPPWNAREFDPNQSRDLADLVARKLSQVEEKYRVVISLHHLQGLSLRETAARLHVAQETVKKRLARGIEQLRDAFGSDGKFLTIAAIELLLLRARPNNPAVSSSASGERVSSQARLSPTARLAVGTAAHKFAFAAAAAILLATAIAGAIPLLASRRPSARPPPPSPVQAAASPSRLAAMSPRQPPTSQASRTAFQELLQFRMRTIHVNNGSLKTTAPIVALDSGIRIDADWKAIEDAGIDPRVRVDGDLESMTATEAVEKLIVWSGASDRLSCVVGKDRLIIAPAAFAGDAPPD